MIKVNAGWFRLWIIASILVGALTFLAVYNLDTNNYYSTGVTREQIKTADDQNRLIESYLLKPGASADVIRCKQQPYVTPYIGDRDVNMFFIYCPKGTAEKLIEAGLFSIVPSLIMLLFGLLVVWVRRGFSR